MQDPMTTQRSPRLGFPRRVADVVAEELSPISERDKATWSKADGDLLLYVRRQRYSREESETFSYRRILFHIASQGEPVAAGLFVEWAAPAGLLDEFLYVADAQSQADHDTADILVGAWSDDTSPFLYGTVVRFERLVIRSGHYSTQVWSLVSYLIDREFARRGSILMLKAFPLEYERQTTQAPRSVYKRLRRRKLAMERYYTYRLGTRSVPGPYGKDGWMWRPLRHCEPPARWKRYKL
jgi:hypothetical protein